MGAKAIVPIALTTLAVGAIAATGGAATPGVAAAAGAGGAGAGAGAFGAAGYAALAGASATALGTMQQGIAAKQAADYEADVAKQNAKRAEIAAEQAVTRGEAEVAQHRLRVAQSISNARAAAAARGVLVDSGSALDLTSTIATSGEIDALTLGYNARQEADSFLDRGGQFRSEASLQKQAGSGALIGSSFSAAGGLLTSGSLVADRWYKYNPDAGSTG